MSIRRDAQRLLDQMAQTELSMERMAQNRAYEVYADELLNWLEVGSRISDNLKALVREVQLLEIQDSAQLLYPSIWRRLGIELAQNQRQFEKQVKAPMLQLLETVEGVTAKARWSLEPSGPRPLPPVIAIRERWALLVGVGGYIYEKTGLNSLSTPIADAKAINDVLLSDQRYGNQQSKTKLLTDEGACHDNILSALEAHSKAADSEDMLLFYFSGHGDLMDDNALLIPYDYDRLTPIASSILIAEATKLMDSSRAKAKIIILDACHAGPDIPLGDEQKKGIEKERGMNPEFVSRVFEQARGSAILSSCTANQVSWTYKEKGLSAFTHFLCEGLHGQADFDRKEFVTVSDVFHFVANGVKGWSEEKRLTQTPALHYTTTGEIILVDYRQRKGT